MKTGAWLRGGRGKIAGMVAQKSSDGKGTVLRELVVPKNPQTIDQMATRLAFGTVTQAAALMLPIIGQTFRGMGNETRNRRRFVSLNVPMLKDEAVAQQAGSGINGAFRGKSSSALIPNSYIMAEGSITLPEPLRLTISNGQLEGSIIGSIADFLPGHEYSPADLLANALGVRKTQQITGVFITTQNVAGPNYSEVVNGDFVRDTNFYGMRIVFNTNDEKFTFTEETTIANIKNYFRNAFDLSKTSEAFLDFLIDGLELNGHSCQNADPLLDAVDDIITDDEKLVAACYIVSENVNGVWDYSNSQLVCVPATGSVEFSNKNWYGLAFNNALVDYLGAEAASKLYTRKGGLINDI